MSSSLDYFKMRLEATCSPMDVKKYLSERAGEVFVIDVRNGPPELLKEKIKGAVEIPESQLAQRINEIPREREVILYCWETWCSLAIKAAVILLEQGYTVRELYGGLSAWKTLGLPTEKVLGNTKLFRANCDCSM